jgi:predicted secreted protein
MLCAMDVKLLDKKVSALQQRLKDGRSGKVVFLSHCILNENTRYFGGARRGGCVNEIVQNHVKNQVGMVQMPCPEQHAWGGVTKRWLLAAYGSHSGLLYRFRGTVLRLFVLYTKLVYGRLARAVARQIADYLDSGCSVTCITGIDGSPSCGVETTLDLGQSFQRLAELDINTVTVERINEIVRQSVIRGRGLYTALLQRELQKRRISVPFIAHDLIAEIEANE